jgi:hypothetical protein
LSGTVRLESLTYNNSDIVAGRCYLSPPEQNRGGLRN